MKNDSQKKDGFFSNLAFKAKKTYAYVTDGVWSDPKNTAGTRMVKTINLTLSAFFNSSLQNKSMSLTYQTVLSVVPAFALLVAIGRGFGLQDALQGQLYQMFPSQDRVITTALSFVDSYLNSATQGVFVGVGIVVLLWTVISLLSSIEDTFNSIWGVTTSRTLYQKFTDYIAICLMIPVLMICSSGVSIFMSSVIQANLKLPFLTPVVNWSLELAPLFLCWLAFALSYYLIPNTKVQFKYAAVAALLAAVSFQILQILFLNGQIYVSKYNAIYGSFAFLPLLLIWLQLSWLVLLTGCMIAYSMQNVFTFNLMGDESAISNRGWHNVALIVMAVTVKRFHNRLKPLTMQQIAVRYYLPIRIVGRIVEKLKEAKLIYDVTLPDRTIGISSAVESENFTVADFLKAFDNVGVTIFISDFKQLYKDMLAQIEPQRTAAYNEFSGLLMKDLQLPDPELIKQIMADDTNVANDIKN
ncbi:MAG: YihY/virulence factor BrkB family protein [Muribaculaceae bacterium]|nr:YihY/virulence factor BrkB family protein [Muribaculaceae bacterium]